MEINEITGQVIDAAIKVHTALGPGLLESAYEACLMYELNKRGLVVRNQVPLPVKYEDVIIEVGHRIDLLVAETVIVELKSVDAVAPIHKAQLLSYLKLSERRSDYLSISTWNYSKTASHDSQTETHTFPPCSLCPLW
jgi:GxxExxY protein